MTGSFEDSWVVKTTRLKFTIGEFCLFSTYFPALVLDIHFAKLPRDLEEPLPPPGAFTSKVRAALVPSHPIVTPLPRFTVTRHYIRYVPSRYRRYYVDLSGSFSDYLNKFSPKTRSTLLRKVRRFGELSGGEISWREYSHAGEMEEFYQMARDVSAKTYQEKLLDSGFPASSSFRQEILDLASHDLARGYILFCRGRPIAYMFCRVDEHVILYDYVGYDPEYGRWSVGTVLQYRVLEKLFGEGRFRLFDFAEGEGSHKEFFSTGSTQCSDIYYFRRTVRDIIMLATHTAVVAVSRSLGRVLDLLQVKARIKKLFRSGG